MGVFWETSTTKKKKKVEDVTAKIKLSKGQTIDTLIETARKLVEEKLGKYKDTSKCVLQEEELIKFFNETPDGGVIGIDTETTGLNVFTDKLVGISVCNGKSCLYIPVNHISYVTHTRLPSQINLERVKDIFGEVFKTKSNIKWVYHNAKFDLGVLRTFFGYPMPNPYWDTMLGACLFNQDEEHSLKFQYNKYIAVEDEGVNRFDNLFHGITFDFVPLDVATIYAGKDAFMTLELYEYQKQQMDRKEFSGLKYVMENIEMPLLPILEDMQRTGVNMNQGMINDLYEKYSIKLEEAKSKVYAEIDKNKDKIDRYRREHYDAKLDDPINLGSPAQLSTLFYKILGYKLKDGGNGTGIDKLQELNTPLTLALVDYRKMSKLIDAFLVALPKKLEPFDNKIHTSLNQYGAATGRFSSSEPNLQQIPSRGDAKELRRIFGASKGYILMSSDFSQQEPRCLASLSGDEKMQEAYRTGKDLYATMASDIYKMPYEDCMEFYLDENGKKTDKTNPEGKKRRSATKSILLGIMYGRGVPSIAEQIHSTTEEAQKIVDDFYKAFPTIKEYTEMVQEEAKKNGFTTTAWGRRRYLKYIQSEPFEFRYNDNRPIDFNPLFTSNSGIHTEVPQYIKDGYLSDLENANSYKRKKIIDEARENGITILNNGSYIAEALRQCLNSVIQGSSADMSKKAMILLGTNEELKSLGFRMLFPVHDEVIAECPFENRKRCAQLMSQLMIQSGADRISVPMKCDVEAFFYWYGPDVSLDDSEITEQQFKDYDTTGIYKDEEYYKVKG